jgi:hypothetical protein
VNTQRGASVRHSGQLKIMFAAMALTLSTTACAAVDMGQALAEASIGGAHHDCRPESLHHALPTEAAWCRSHPPR